MSATTEKLLEDIERTQQELSTCVREGNAVAVVFLKKTLTELTTRLSQANALLNEGAATVLKD
jgi:hypothetical protein